MGTGVAETRGRGRRTGSRGALHVPPRRRTRAGERPGDASFYLHQHLHSEVAGGAFSYLHRHPIPTHMMYRSSEASIIK